MCGLLRSQKKEDLMFNIPRDIPPALFEPLDGLKEIPKICAIWFIENSYFLNKIPPFSPA
jgi:hypothetical protein